MIGLLDYDKAQIRMYAETEVERTKRLGACKKEPETLAFLEAIPEGSVLFDIGANVGSYTLIALSRGIETVAFEASVPNFKRLNENIKLNGFHAKTVCAPLWSHKADIEWVQSSDEVGAALHSIGTGKGNRQAFPLDFWIDPKGPSRLPRPTHIKLDVDGCEMQVLQGAVNALRSVQGLLVETDRTQPSHERLPRFLSEWGFSVASTHPHGESPVTNVIFTKR